MHSVLIWKFSWFQQLEVICNFSAALQNEQIGHISGFSKFKVPNWLQTKTHAYSCPCLEPIWDLPSGEHEYRDISTLSWQAAMAGVFGLFWAAVELPDTPCDADTLYKLVSHQKRVGKHPLLGKATGAWTLLEQDSYVSGSVSNDCMIWTSSEHKSGRTTRVLTVWYPARMACWWSVISTAMQPTAAMFSIVLATAWQPVHAPTAAKSDWASTQGPQGTVFSMHSVHVHSLRKCYWHWGTSALLHSSITTATSLVLYCQTPLTISA